jgi:flagellar hook-associated protein 1 FlgK
MSNIFGITVSALEAFQTALSVTSNNVANANTPGYAVESIELTSAVPESASQTAIGNGVNVVGVTRAFNQATENQMNSSQSSLSQLDGLQNYTDQINNIVGTTAGGLSTALQSYYSAWSNVADNPTSAASRQSLISQAQGVASSFQSTSTQLQALNTDVNSRVTADVQQINSIAKSISSLNQQIVVGTAEGSGQAPNQLLDQRDQLLTNLNKLVGVTTTTDTNGALNVFVGNGQPLVLQGNTTALTTAPNPFNAAQLEISTSTSPGNLISSSITSGDLGGLLAARTQAINPALNQLGQLAIGLATAANTQQNTGLDLNGNLGSKLFSVAAPVATPSSQNTGTASVAASVANVGALTADNYLLSYQNNAYSLTDQTTGANVPFTGTGTGTAQNPLTAAGLSIVITTGAPNNGDQFLIQPTAQAAASFSVVLQSTSQIAAAGAIATSAAGANTGNATISAGTVASPPLTAAQLTTPATTIQFTSPTTYEINGAGSNVYTSGANIVLNGWQQVSISGVPAANDVFTVAVNTAGTGDNRNALASAAGESTGVLANGTVSITSGTGGLITGIGTQSAQVNTAQTAQSAVTTQALQSVQSLSGVNLDQEAANLVQWQQAYQASAQVLTVANSLFTSLLSAVNGSSS